MASLGLVVALCLVTCTHTAPESSREVLQDIHVEPLSKPDAENERTKEVATVLKFIPNGKQSENHDIEAKKINTHPMAGEKESPREVLHDLHVKPLSESDTDIVKTIKEIDNIIGAIQNGVHVENKDVGVEKSSSDLTSVKKQSPREILHDLIVKYLNESNPEIIKTKELEHVLKAVGDRVQAEASKKGAIDRGFVSDLIESTLSGVQMGLSIGNTNGTANQLCIKLGNISMGGCRRTAVQKENPSLNTTMGIRSEQNATHVLPTP